MRSIASNRVICLLFVVVTGLIGFTRAAQAQGGYVGVGFGSTSTDISKSDVEALRDIGIVGVPLGSSTSVDDSDSGWKIFGGFRLNENFAIEAAWVDLGEATARSSAIDSVFGDTVTVNFSTEADGIALMAVGTVPLARQISAYGKIGLFLWDVDASADLTSNIFGPLAAANVSDDGTDPVFGAGIEWKATKEIALRLEWERYADVGDEDIDLFGVGALVRF